MLKELQRFVCSGVPVVLVSLVLGDPGIVDFERSGLEELAIGEHTVVENFPLGAAGRVTLDLERFSVLAPDALVVESSANGDRELLQSELVLLKGTIVGEDEGSTVFISVGRWGTNGFVQRSGEMYSISSGPYTGLLGVRPTVLVTPAAELSGLQAVGCGYAPEDPAYNPPYAGDGLIEPMPMPSGRGGLCNLAAIAVDTDYEFTANLFGGNTQASADYVRTLFGAVSTVYERDVGVAMNVSFIRVWADDSDPYGTEDIGGFLDKVRIVWRASMGEVPRVITHALSGRALGGGVAYVNTLCSTDWGYGISANIAGSFPYPLGDHASGNWDPYVVAHETGHNFGTGHTHDSYDPVIDSCGLGDCSSAWGGTIMSYCHTCPGGMRNIEMSFHPRVQEVIEATVAASSCVSDVPGGATGIDDRGETIAGLPVTLDVVLNDLDQSCGVPTIVFYDTPTAHGGVVERVTGSDRDRLRYTPGAGFTGEDSFTYTLDGGASATVRVGVHTLLAPDQPVQPEPGVAVSYFMLNSPTALPDFETMTPYFETIAEAMDFAESGGIFASSALANNVGAVFEGFVEVPVPSLYAFEIESDEGSRLYIGGELVVDHDGLHGMERKSGVVGLLPGLHRVRIEYFEAEGNAGLIVRNATMGLTPVAIPPSAWFHDEAPACAPDLNSDGTLDFFDVQSFLALFVADDPVGDWNSDGVWDFFDVQTFLADFAAGCP